ncbi:MAG: indole-3-glycerol-phosphate synthase [Candidatus Dormibacteria bacterium]
MADVLDAIVARLREELEAHPPDLPRLRDLAQGHRPRDFRAAIEAGPRPALIAEFKRRSPSRGPLKEGATIHEQCRAYVQAGASALSILTNADFGGSLLDLRDAREVVDVPLLRKDFIVDQRQLLQAAAYGADCVLLVARIVPPAQLVELSAAAHELNLQALVELYEESELEAALAAKPDLIGVNSRDLATFDVDDTRFGRVAAALPAGLPLVAESGVHSRDQVIAAGAAGARAVLIGEALMTAPDPCAAARSLLGAVMVRPA